MNNLPLKEEHQLKRILSSLLAAMIAVSGITALGFTAVSA